MSRESTQPPTTADEHDSTDAVTQERNRKSFSRRDCLKLTGATAASIAAATTIGATPAAAQTGYRTVVVPPGEQVRRVVDSGETLQNVLFDIRAQGADVKIVASGRNWEIKNIGVRGRASTDEGQIMNLSVAGGSTGRVENVYLGDGAVAGDHNAVFVPLRHAGTLIIRRMNVQKWPNNGIYGSAPGRTERGGQRGLVRIQECYARNNNIANYRLDSNGSSIRNSVVHVDRDVPDVFGGKENSRGVWVKEGGRVTIENCDILLDHPDATVGVIEQDNDMTGVARVIDSEVEAREGARRFAGNVQTQNVGRDPDVTPPGGVPLSAVAAARSDALSNTLEIVGQDADDGSSYQFDVSGALEAIETNPDDEVGRNTASGFVFGSSDRYQFSGELTDFRRDGPLRVFVNGQEVDPGSLADLPNELRIIGTGDPATYAFSVSDTLQPGNGFDNDGSDTIDGTAGAGRVNGTSGDGFDFAGEITDFRYSGSLRVLINGQEVDPDSLGRAENELRITGTGERAPYEFTVSGELQPGDEFDTDGTDSISGRTGSGRVNGTSGDDFVFTGEVTDFQYSGSLRVFINGQEIDPLALARPASELRIVAQGERATYTFTVSGGLQPGEKFDTDGTDLIEGRTGSGRVNGTSADNFLFGGDITDFAVGGPVRVFVDGEEVDPDSLG